MTGLTCAVYDEAHPNGCARPPEVPLIVTRPCGHHWPLTTCTGHAEALVGENDLTQCHRCFQLNRTTVTPR